MDELRSRGTRERPGRGYTFVSLGSFSGVNGVIAPMLAESFCELEPEAFEIAAWARANRRFLAANAAYALAEYGPLTFTGRDRLRHSFYRTSYFFTRVRKEARERISPSRNAFSFQTQSMFDAGVPGVPHFVYTDHTALANTYYPDFDPGSVPEPLLAREREIYQHAALIFTMSRHVSRSLDEHYGIDPERVRCVYAGSNVGHESDGNESAAGRAGKQILFVGREWERKGGPELLAAFSIVRESHPDATLVVVGCSPRIDAEGVRVLGEIPAPAVAREYRASAVFCMPTRAEPFGLVYVEALSYGVPVVATSIGAIPDVVQDGETGLLTGPGEVGRIAESLSALLSDPERRRQFGELGRERMAQRYTWPRVVDSMTTQIREVIGRV
jgi:glycosyltransferase involved in cell wall biosynthesis